MDLMVSDGVFSHYNIKINGGGGGGGGGGGREAQANIEETDGERLQ